ncbi:uncharacterized protein LOC133352892 [Lethenteron reissneri]|uniref:uncharacterized protein LOC133352892 n=1 Tax=Lethenteron reissneri TaxID=7753 RepID=UPI002AB680A8|nr:uncharacterized protein LOC133352892 [Lethenteron reissneri]XP_061424870.1 uncharacterized protein LOC133352892 [Lethenteron reissneri]
MQKVQAPMHPTGKNAWLCPQGPQRPLKSALKAAEGDGDAKERPALRVGFDLRSTEVRYVPRVVNGSEERLRREKAIMMMSSSKAEEALHQLHLHQQPPMLLLQGRRRALSTSSLTDDLVYLQPPHGSRYEQQLQLLRVPQQQQQLHRRKRSLSVSCDGTERQLGSPGRVVVTMPVKAQTLRTLRDTRRWQLPASSQQQSEMMDGPPMQLMMGRRASHSTQGTEQHGLLPRRTLRSGSLDRSTLRLVPDRLEVPPSKIVHERRRSASVITSQAAAKPPVAPTVGEEKRKSSANVKGRAAESNSAGKVGDSSNGSPVKEDLTQVEENSKPSLRVMLLGIMKIKNSRGKDTT